VLVTNVTQVLLIHSTSQKDNDTEHKQPEQGYPHNLLVLPQGDKKDREHHRETHDDHRYENQFLFLVHSSLLSR
jgi:hypothetical protein